MALGKSNFLANYVAAHSIRNMLHNARFVGTNSTLEHYYTKEVSVLLQEHPVMTAIRLRRGAVQT